MRMIVHISIVHVLGMELIAISGIALKSNHRIYAQLLIHVLGRITLARPSHNVLIILQ